MEKDSRVIHSSERLTQNRFRIKYPPLKQLMLTWHIYLGSTSRFPYKLERRVLILYWILVYMAKHFCAKWKNGLPSQNLNVHIHVKLLDLQSCRWKFIAYIERNRLWAEPYFDFITFNLIFIMQHRRYGQVKYLL